MASFVTGIVIGVCASAVFAFLCLFIKRVMLPWAQNLFYDAPSLSGDWQVYYSTDSSSDSAGTLHLKHFGRRLDGKARLWRNRAGEEVDRKLLFRGSFRAGQVLASYEDEHLKGYVVGVVLLKLMGKDRFVGKSVYCHPSQDTVEAYDLCLRR